VHTSINVVLAYALVLGSVSTSFVASHTAHHRHAYAVQRLAPPDGSGGRQVAAPLWSFACTTDRGPGECNGPMWVYAHTNGLRS
jgi:hypothetical protein